MQSVHTQNFDGLLTPTVPDPFIVHCATCGERVLQGAGPVQLSDIQHLCPDTTSALREYSVIWQAAELADPPPEA